MKLKDLGYYSWRIIKYRLGSQSPLIASIKLTYKCNLKCLHCPWTDLETQRFLSLEEWMDVILLLKRQGVRVVFLEGGETTLYPELKELISKTKELGLRVAVNTNGSNDLSSFYPDCFIVSIDGEEITHDKIRGKGSYQKMLQNCQTTKVRRIGLMTVSKLNLQSIRNVIEFNLSTHLFDALGFTIAYPVEKLVRNRIDLNKEEQELAYSYIEEFKEEIDIINSRPSLKAETWTCKPWFVKVVEPDGAISGSNDCLVTVAGEEKNCKSCHAGCYKEAMQILDGNLDAWYIWNKYFFQ